MDITAIKIQLTPDLARDFQYAEVMVPLYEDGRKEAGKIPSGELVNMNIKQIPEKRQRSNEQLNLYWASCQAVADNTENDNYSTKEKVDEQTKLKLGHVEYELVFYNEQTGDMEIHRKTKSVSFAKLKHLEACGYFTDAFNLHAKSLGLPVEEWIAYVQSRMSGII